MLNQGLQASSWGAAETLTFHCNTYRYPALDNRLPKVGTKEVLKQQACDVTAPISSVFTTAELLHSPPLLLKSASLFNRSDSSVQKHS